MARIHVVVATTSKDVKAEVIAESVAMHSDMDLVEDRCFPAEEVDALLQRLPTTSPVAVVLVGRPSETGDMADWWLAERDDLVVMLVDIIDDVVRIAVRDPKLDSLLALVRGLVERGGEKAEQRVARIKLRLVHSLEPNVGVAARVPPPTPVLGAALDWLHLLLRDAVERLPDPPADGDQPLPLTSLTRAMLLQSFDAPIETEPAQPLTAASEALDRALATAQADAEPLGKIARDFSLTPLELRTLLLTLAPELDLRFQRAIGFLLDDMSRRVGTLALYNGLLGLTTSVRAELAQAGALSRCLAFEMANGQHAAADEPLRLDPFLARWLLGEAEALAQDPRVRRALRPVAWSGEKLLQRYEDRLSASSLLGKVLDSNSRRWLLLGGSDPSELRALLELGATARKIELIRVEAQRLASVDLLEVEDCGVRLGRMARLSGRLLVIDASNAPSGEADDDWMRVLFQALEHSGCAVTVICKDPARRARLFGSAAFDQVDEQLSLDARVGAIRTAASGAKAELDEDSARSFASRYPLSLEGFDLAMRLAQSRSEAPTRIEPALSRFAAACNEVAAEGISQLAAALEPSFGLEDVILPADRQQQLTEIVDNVRLAGHVLDNWKFGEQLPYGRGVAALFCGPSGTGKTMAAIGIARRLGIRLLRLDLSRVVSKYIGDTEKNIDRVFQDAKRSGAAILIDEAEALLGKRSEVKDAHDRYANIEVAYLLQRMEAYEGLAVLTTNLRQNLDPAFVRRLRFIIDFPRPDAQSREHIWRRCLPEASHILSDADFRQLAKRIDLTGGHIRQITLRAAFIAAAAGEQICLAHIARACTAEFAKLGMPTVELDLSQSRRAA